MMKESKWERIHATALRLAVPGGWIYTTEFSDTENSICFVPDPRITLAGQMASGIISANISQGMTLPDSDYASMTLAVVDEILRQADERLAKICRCCLENEASVCETCLSKFIGMTRRK